MTVSKIITAAVARSVAGLGTSVTTPQLRVLVMLASLGRLNLTRVADGLGVNPSSASRTCDQLVSQDLVSRTEDPQDRRHIVLQLTEDGTSLVDALMSHRRELFNQVTARMRPEDRRRLARGLEKFAEAAGEGADDESDDADSLLRWLV